LNTEDTEAHRGSDKILLFQQPAIPLLDLPSPNGSPRLSDEPKNISPDDMEQAISGLNQELASLSSGTTQRIDCNSENIEQGLARLVLSLIELLRRLLERQAIRRMEGGSLADAQIEEMGLALMKLEEKIRELASQFGLRPEDLNLDLGPLGQLWTDEKK
jgi:hypothetical protein